MLAIIKQKLEELKTGETVPTGAFKKAQTFYLNEDCQMLTQSQSKFDFAIKNEEEEGEEEVEVSLRVMEDDILPLIDKKEAEWNAYSLAALLQLSEKMSALSIAEGMSGRKYTREGMMRRVLSERQQRAMDAEYSIEWGDTIYGEHLLINERDIAYRITLRDFENEIGYVDSIDLRTNKLGTTKHIMFAFQKLKSNEKLLSRLGKEYPFVEIFLDPLNDYKITWFYPHELDADISKLIKSYFGAGHVFPDEHVKDFLGFINKAEEFEQIVIRTEVSKKVEDAYNKALLERLRRTTSTDYSIIKAELFPYQKEGVEFALFREGTIIADDMGLGKTLQAITTAVFKKRIFD